MTVTTTSRNDLQEQLTYHYNRGDLILCVVPASIARDGVVTHYRVYAVDRSAL